MNWTLILCVLGLTTPPSVAYVVSLIVQWRIERSRELSKQHESVLTNHEQTIEEHSDKLAGLSFIVEQQQKEISKLNDREY